MSEISDMEKRVHKEREKQYAYNSCQNWQRIYDQSLEHNYSVSKLPSANGAPALILGSGPSLDDCIEYVSSFQGLIFASLSQVNILEKFGIKPNFLVAMDSVTDAADVLSDYHTNLVDTTLLTFPGISPKVLEKWGPRKVRYFLLTEDRLDEARFPWIESKYPMMGCITNMAMLLADTIGCNPLVLAGVDFCYPDGRKRAQDYRHRGPFIFEPKPIEYVQTQPGKTSTSQEQIFYAALTYALWKSFRLNLVRVGDKSALDLIPSIKPEDLGGKLDFKLDPPNDAAIDEFTKELGIYCDTTGGKIQIHYKDRDIAEGGKWADFWGEP